MSDIYDPHGSEGKPQRAHSLVAVFGADTAEALAQELEAFADRIRRADVTVGVSGSPSAGAIYSYRVNPHQTHAAYFQAVNEWLAARRNGTKTDRESATAPAGSATDGAGDAAKPLK